MGTAAVAYGLARRYAADPRFAFGTGKLGYLAGFANAVVLALVAVLIGVESVTRLFAPEAVDYASALPPVTLKADGMRLDRRNRALIEILPISCNEGSAFESESSFASRGKQRGVRTRGWFAWSSGRGSLRGGGN